MPLSSPIVGEAAVLAVLGKRTRAQQAETIIRSAARAETATVSTVIRTAQDHADRDDHPAVAWLETLVAQADGEAIERIADQLPEHTVRLRVLAVRVYEKLVEAQETAAEAGDMEARLCSLRR